MAVQTAAANVRTTPRILSAITRWFDRAAASKCPETVYFDAVARTRAEILDDGQKNLSGTSRKRLENALSDFSGI